MPWELKASLLAIIPIFVAMDAIGVLPLFISLTEGMKGVKRQRVVCDSILTGFVVGVGFLAVGKFIFAIIGVTIADFKVAGGNPHALDTTICRIIGIPPEELLTIQAAQQRGVEGIDPKQIEVLGLSAEDVGVTPFRLPRRFDIQWNLPGFLRKPLKNIFTPKPIVNGDQCKVCGACAEVCPPQAIALSDKRVEIDYHQCIRCYCCQEVCPEGAVHLQEGWVRRLAS